MYKALFLDIDGTILDTKHEIPKSTKEAVYQLQEQGFHVVIATGRPAHDTTPIADELNINSYISFCGGYGVLKGEELFQKPFEEQTVDFLISNSQLFSHDLLLSNIEQNLASNLHSPLFYSYTNEFGMHYAPLDSKNPPKVILGGTLLLEKAEEIELYQFPKYFTYTKGNSNDIHAYEITLPSVNKGSAVKEFIEKLGIHREQTIAFGDGLNDKEMLSFVGVGVAMGNGHRDLHQYANFTTTSVDDDGIWNGLVKLGLVK